MRLPRKTIFNTLQNTSECHEVPRLPRENEATTRLKPPKMTTSAGLPIGTAIRGSRERLRTVADGCGRLRTVADADATSSEHTLNPQTPRVKREPLLRIREKEELSKSRMMMVMVMVMVMVMMMMMMMMLMLMMMMMMILHRTPAMYVVIRKLIGV